MRRISLRIRLAVLLLIPLDLLAQPDTADTRLLHSPAVSRDHIAFVYADDLWICDLDGRNVRRLTSDPGIEGNLAFSPDGRTIAFSGQYDAASPGFGVEAASIYTVPVTGGEPTRLTWYGWDFVRGWTPDGKAVLFNSWREVAMGSDTPLFTVPAAGGFPSRLPVPNGRGASYSPDGSRLAYMPLFDNTAQWKNYRGGGHSRIWIQSLKDLAVEQIPQPAGRCNDIGPRWMGDSIYFRSDRNGEYNLFAYDTKTKTVRQLTAFDDFPVLSLDAGGGNLVFEQAGYLHRFDLATGRSQRLKIGVVAELPETRTRYARGAKQVRSGHISPSGARAVFGFRGEIVTVPAAKGDARDITNTPGVHERFPVWSPDGKSIAFFSDQGGEYALHVLPADGKGKARVYKLAGAGFYEAPAWSPDSTKIAYVDNSWTLYWLDLESGAVKKVASEPVFGLAHRRSLRAAWSPDSQWIAYALGNLSAYRTVYVYSLAKDESRAVTDGMSDATEPAFDASGKYLHFLASTDAGPVNQWFNLSSRKLRATYALYLALLRKDTPSPFVRESDEEKPGAKEEKKDEPGKPEPVRIDFDGLDRRLLPFPLPGGEYRTLTAGGAGQVLYLSQLPPQPGQPTPPDIAALMRYDLAQRKGETLLSGVNDYRSTPDGKKALVLTAPETWSIVELDPPSQDALVPGADAAKGKLNLDAAEVRVEPRTEWPQIFDEAWRINRDYFYDPNMHGADWPAMKKKYAAFLPHLASSEDLYRVIRWMLSELSVSHSDSWPGDRAVEPKAGTGGGLLGADYEIANGRYRFRKVYGGVAWWPDLRAPLAAPGVDVKAGEYLLAVRGVDLKPPTDVYAPFVNTGDESVEITVGPHPDGSGARTVTVEPLATMEEELRLRNVDWVEGNRRKVEQATGGRVAYVYLPNTGDLGYDYFTRYFYSQLDKDAVILDERYNGGGAWADYYMDPLRRPFSSYWAMRYGADFRSPSAAIHGPKVMLINEQSGSGGDGLPFMFRQSKLGPLVGKRTWGGEVGVLGYPELMDGGGVTAPNFALWSPEGGWVIENEGVAPDVEVENWPADLVAGRDPQLEKAIEIVLEELKKNPPVKPQRLPYPVRVQRD
ncbi:MAG TPA: PDZ domain-containing protein [Thermoanaerobaculia bacterium]